MNKILLALVAFLATLLVSNQSFALASSEESAKALILTVDSAAKRGDWNKLVEHMSAGFVYRVGVEGSREAAIAQFFLNTKMRRAMTDVLGQGCKRAGGRSQDMYICPPQAADADVIYFGYRAGFRKMPEGPWMFDYFFVDE